MALDTAPATPLDVTRLRADFPILAERVNGHPLAYLDNASTSQKPEAVIRAPDDREVVFTRGTTEAINLVAYAWGRANVGQGDVLIATEMEHHSNLVPWQILAQERGASLEFITLTPEGRLDLDEYD